MNQYGNFDLVLLFISLNYVHLQFSYNLETSNMILCRWPLWLYGLWSFLNEGTELESFLPKNQHTQKKLLNFESWINGEVSKIEHRFRK